MSLILNIDTATETAHVSIAKDGIVLKDLFNHEQKNHAGFLQPAIKKIAEEAGITLSQIDAIAVTEGPGSYTGLRIGMASAKGLCFALNKPLITINTLEALAQAAINELKIEQGTLLCPMIDARRMEVFTAVYDTTLKIILPPCAMILEKTSFEEILTNQYIIFFGSGAEKWKNICKNNNAFFQNIGITSMSMSRLSAQKMLNHQFAETAYSEPFYIKEFYING